MSERAPENFIPWEQFADLVTPGMTFGELGNAVIARALLPRDRYEIVSVPCPTHWSIASALRRGLFIISRAEGDRLQANNEMLYHGRSVIA